MADNLPVSQMQDKNGVTYDIAAKRMSGTRTITITGDVTGSVTTNLSGAVSLDVGIADNAVDTSCIADGAVTTSCLADNNVTLQKLSSELRESVGEAHTHDNKSLLDKYAAAGSASIPTYIAADGTPTACTDDFVHDAELTAEATTRANADTTLQGNIDAEATTRASADTALGNRITTLEAKTALSDFTDDITTSTYSSTGTAPVNGTAVASALDSATHSTHALTARQNTMWFSINPINNWVGNVRIEVMGQRNSDGKTFHFDIHPRLDSGAVSATVSSYGVTSTDIISAFHFYKREVTEGSTTVTTLIGTVEGTTSTTYRLRVAYASSAVNVTLLDESMPSSGLTEGTVSYRNGVWMNGQTMTGSSTAPVYVNANGQVTACTDDFVHDAELTAGLATKQNTLTFDTTPTASSTNPVTSDGIKTYVDAVNTSAQKSLKVATNGCEGKSFNFSSTTEATFKANSSTEGSLANCLGHISSKTWVGEVTVSLSSALQTYLHMPAYPQMKVSGTGGTAVVEFSAAYNSQGYYGNTRVLVSPNGILNVQKILVERDVTSTYSSTDTAPVNGTAVASALSSYMPLSRLKPSTDMAGFDSDDTNAYTGKAISQKITDAISGNVGGWLGNKTVDEVNELDASEMKTGDYVTLTDGGTVTLGNVAVTAGDEIYWVSSTSVWQKKDNTVYVKHTDIASSSGTGVVRASSDDGKVEVNSSGVMSVNGWSTVKNDVSTAQTNISTLQSTTAQHTSDIASVNSAIIAMSVDKQGGDGKYIRSISQSNGKISVEAVSLDTDLTDSSLGDNAPSSAAVKNYVDAQVAAEATARESAIELAVGNESSARESAIAAETSARESAVAAEASARDSAISSAIATEVTNRNTAIENGVWEAKYDSETETLKFMNLSFTAS